MYHPTHQEIDEVLCRGVTRYPQHARRYDRAGAILAAGDLDYYRSTPGWACLSSCRRHSYQVSFTQCDCPDFHDGACVLGGKVFCKHKIALLALREIAGAHIAQRVVGNNTYHANAYRARTGANAALLLLPPERGSLIGSLCCYRHSRDHIPFHLCEVRWTGRGHRPAYENDLAAFLEWLEKAAPLPASLASQLVYSRLRSQGESEAAAASAADAALIAGHAPVDF